MLYAPVLEHKILLTGILKHCSFPLNNIYTLKLRRNLKYHKIHHNFFYILTPLLPLPLHFRGKEQISKTRHLTCRITVQVAIQ